MHSCKQYSNSCKSYVKIMWTQIKVEQNLNFILGALSGYKSLNASISGQRSKTVSTAKPLLMNWGVLLWKYIHSRNPSSTLSLAPCIVVKGFVGQATNQPQVESGVAAYGDCSPSHCQWSPLRNQAATLETTAQLVKHRSHCDRLPHNDLYVYHMKTIFYCLTITQRTKTFGKIYTTLKIKMTF